MFLDVSARNNHNKVETYVYRKSTCMNNYINWCSHAPSNWKIGILRNLIKRVKSISSSELFLRNEISYSRRIFMEYNDFPLNVVNNIIDQELSQPAQQKQQNPKARKLNKHYS